MFGLSSKSRFLCIDIQFDEVYFVVVCKEGASFQIDFSQVLVVDKGVFDGMRVRAPGKIADVLHDVKKKFGPIPTLITVPETFSYTTLLPGETYSSGEDVRKVIDACTTVSSYAWTHTFQKNSSPCTVLHVTHKQICDALYSLLKNSGFTTVTLYPRALALGELHGLQNEVVCDLGRSQTTLLSIYNGYTIGFSTITYGKDYLSEKIKKRFALQEKEAEEVLIAYGTEVLPRKEGHVVQGIVHTFLAPLIDEIRSLEMRRLEYGVSPSRNIFVGGIVAQYEGIVDDIARMGRANTHPLNIWEGVIDFNKYIPPIQKKDSYMYIGIAGLMNILKKGTQYKPFVDR